MAPAVWVFVSLVWHLGKTLALGRSRAAAAQRARPPPHAQRGDTNMAAEKQPTESRGDPCASSAPSRTHSQHLL